MTEIEICTLNGVKWLLGDEAPERMTWQRAKDWCESIGQQLPPREVLLMAYLNPEIRSSFENNYYWSSSEDGSDFAWNQSFIIGNQLFSNKSNSLTVRAVRAIKGLTPREGLTEYKKGYARAELDVKREPLSNEAVCKILIRNEWKGFADLVRMVEKAHGIGVEE